MSEMNGYQALSTYRRQQIETASPGQLIVMLYDGAIRHCQSAQSAIASGDKAAAHRHLLKAQDIVAELMASLDMEAGGELATRLLQLYDFIHRRLVEANVRKDTEAIQDAVQLLSGLREAWAQVATASPVGNMSRSAQAGPLA